MEGKLGSTSEIENSGVGAPVALANIQIHTLSQLQFYNLVIQNIQIVGICNKCTAKKYKNF